VPHGEEDAGSELPGMPGYIQILSLPERMRSQSVQLFHGRTAEKIAIFIDSALDKSQKLIKL
jgi:hypothetical protein